MKKAFVTIIRPTGNDTALIQGIPLKDNKKIVNKKILKLFPTVEQVGFYEYDAKNNKGKLEMAGGEFCGNAARSLAYLLLNGEQGEIRLKVSGARKMLKAGIKKRNTAFSEMPIYTSFSSIKKLEDDLFLVPLQGITHLVNNNYPDLQKEELKRYAIRLLEKYSLKKTLSCSGVMCIKEIKKNSIGVEPIVWVRDVKTLFYETACATGTAAIGLLQSLKSAKKKNTFSVIQPSGKKITISVTKKSASFDTATIDGPIEILDQKEVLL